VVSDNVDKTVSALLTGKLVAHKDITTPGLILFAAANRSMHA